MVCGVQPLGFTWHHGSPLLPSQFTLNEGCFRDNSGYLRQVKGRSRRSSIWGAMNLGLSFFGLPLEYIRGIHDGRARPTLPKP